MQAVLFLLLGLVANCDHMPTRVTLDLGMDPEHRWDHIVAAHKETFLHSLDAVFNDPKIKAVIPVAKRLIGNALEARRVFSHDQYLEAKGIAHALGRDASEVILVGAFYDLFAAADSPLTSRACTGVVAHSTSGEIVHGRNLDYDFAQALSESVLVVDFIKNGETMFTAVTFGPNPTFNTAVRHGSFSISHDERDQGSIFQNFWDIVLLGRMATFARIRQAVETIHTFGEAVAFFSTVKVSAASYFILGGTKQDEGAVITRDRSEVVDVWHLNSSAGRWYVLETNYDHWKPPSKNDNRRAPLQRALNAIGVKDINASSMWNAISVRSVNESHGERAPLNNETIYSTVMQAAKPSSFMTLVRIDGGFHTNVIV